MVIRSTMCFDNFAEEALVKVVEQSIGRPFMDADRREIGTIVEAVRVENTKRVEFKIELMDSLVGGVMCG